MKAKLINQFLYVGLGALIVFAVIGVKSIVLNQNTVRATNPTGKSPTIFTKLGETQPSTAPTDTPVIQPIVRPTANSYLSQRVKEIDARIAELEKQKTSAKDTYESSKQQILSGSSPQGYDPANSITALAIAKRIMDNKTETAQQEIDTLNAEKTQIMLKM
jgi:hypothetical protein